MARPGRNCISENILNPARTFFATTKTSMGRRLCNRRGMRELLIEVLRSLVAERKFKLRDFVIMPDHVALLLTVDEGMTVEKAMQVVKGRFSYRLRMSWGLKERFGREGFPRC